MPTEKEIKLRARGIFIPDEILFNPNLDLTEKVMLTQIIHLDNDDSCFASNKYFAKFCSCSITKASNTISKLKSMGLIEETSFDGRQRKLRALVTFYGPALQSINSSLTESVRQTNGIGNHKGKIKDNSKSKVKQQPFIPPSLVDMEVYFVEKGDTKERARAAFEHYSAADWHDSYGSPVKNWKQKCLTNWINKNYDTKKTTSAQKPRGYTDEELFAPFNNPQE